MDNVVQNISIEDIVPSDFQSNYDPQSLDDLTASIKNFGVLEPILVRPKKGKYEIILGNKRYLVAKNIGLTTIPALIKDVDDEFIHQYNTITQGQIPENQNKVETISKNLNQSEKDLPKNLEIPLEKNKTRLEKEEISSQNPVLFNKFNHVNQDIINLSELSKEEYERDEIKMNNAQFNNNLMNNNLGGMPNSTPQPQGPTFGGRFFPSLEDEPTNMNLSMAPEQPQMATSQMSNNMGSNPNLIDLTDIASDKEPVMNNNNNIPTMNPAMENIPEFTIPSSQPTMSSAAPVTPMDSNLPNFGTPTMDNIVNLDNLQTNNQFDNFQSNNMAPISQSQEINQMPPVQDFSMNVTPAVDQVSLGVTPQFDMSQAITPPQFVTTPDISPIAQETQNDFAMNMGVSPQAEPQNAMPIGTENFGASNIPEMNPMNQTIPSEPQHFPQKEVLPVINTLKGVAVSLESFGYKINIFDEDSNNSYRLIIEVEK